MLVLTTFIPKNTLNDLKAQKYTFDICVNVDLVYIRR